MKKLNINSYSHIMNKIKYFMSINMVSENISPLQFVSIDSGNCVISVFLDFKKAFDKINHKILLSKFDF